MASRPARPRLRRRAPVLLVALCAAAAVIVTVASRSPGGSTAATATRGPLTAAAPAQMRAALIMRLHAERLDYRWVACVRTPGRFHSVGVVRCNVDFGIDPHVEAYCGVLRGGQLLTNVDDPAVPCGHDDAGYSATIIRYG